MRLLALTVGLMLLTGSAFAQNINGNSNGNSNTNNNTTSANSRAAAAATVNADVSVRGGGATINAPQQLGGIGGSIAAAGTCVGGGGYAMFGALTFQGGGGYVQTDEDCHKDDIIRLGIEMCRGLGVMCSEVQQAWLQQYQDHFRLKDQKSATASSYAPPTTPSVSTPLVRPALCDTRQNTMYWHNVCGA